MDRRHNGPAGRLGSGASSGPVPPGTGPGPAERRQHPRVAWHLQVADALLLEVEEPGAEWRPIPCTIVDLGPGGLGVLAEEAVRPGSRVRITFPLPDDLTTAVAEQLETVPRLIAGGEVVHARAAPPMLPHVPPEHHRPHHHGVRFHDLPGEAEVRLLRALYGPLPDGWSVERYLPRARADGAGGTARFAVSHNGQRVARGFTTYERARQRAWSMHMDDLAEQSRNRS